MQMYVINILNTVPVTDLVSVSVLFSIDIDRKMFYVKACNLK